jgi:hypothetical protein
MKMMHKKALCSSAQSLHWAVFQHILQTRSYAQQIFCPQDARAKKKLFSFFEYLLNNIPTKKKV